MEHRVAGVSTSIAFAPRGGVVTVTVIVCACGQLYEGHNERQRNQASDAMQQHIGTREGA